MKPQKTKLQKQKKGLGNISAEVGSLEHLAQSVFTSKMLAEEFINLYVKDGFSRQYGIMRLQNLGIFISRLPRK